MTKALTVAMQQLTCLPIMPIQAMAGVPGGMLTRICPSFAVLEAWWLVLLEFDQLIGTFMASFTEILFPQARSTSCSSDTSPLVDHLTELTMGFSKGVTKAFEAQVMGIPRGANCANS